ncbi:leucine-rich repeat-containing protein 66 [Cricetulus griseus]|uniref:Leucine-rich repeat-containing protein 66 n=1 Tax=Cricetulus griseus TaxID=10029 RepID=A0A061IQ21_CRIGR|nr:leucine-rich repeat-containing protein 66 [Cricetulus griseus]
MKDFYVRVTITVIGLCFPGTATNPPRKSGVFRTPEFQWDEHLLANWSSRRHTSQIAYTIDVSSVSFQVFFQSHTRKEWQIKHLDLSNHSISKMTFSPLVPLHTLEVLNLSNNALSSLSLDLPPARPAQQKQHRNSSHRGLLRLKVLILQRNQLSDTPKGLWKLKSLQNLDLSFNRIVHIGLSDFHSCLQLESIYLKSNKICTIHPEAFKGLNKLQVVDLRSNALTTLAPIVTIALELPHLELDLADNQWRCGESNANFQNVTSASWREKWDAICNMSVGNEKPYLETPQIRISREAHLPPTPSDEKSFMQSKAERPQEGMDTHLSTLEKQAQVDHDDLKETRPQEETWMGYDDLEEIQPRPPTELRDSQNRHDTDRKDNDSPDLVLAICLSVFITFVVAFCLGAFARPYIDRLWQQSCLSKRPGSENAYANEGFYDEVEASRRVQCQGTELHQAPHHLNLYESQNPSWVTEPVLYDAVMSERELESSRMEFSGQQNPMQLEDSTGVRSGVCNVLPYAQVAHSALPGLPNVDTQEPISTEQDHYDVPEELHYHTVAQEYSLHEGVMDASSIASPLGTVPSSIDGRWDELHLSQSRDVVAPVSKTVVHTSTQGSGESKERGCPEPLGAMGSPMESSQVTNSIKGLATQLPSFQEADAEEEVSGVYDEVLYNDPEDVDSPSLMPRWDSGPHVTPASKEPVLRGDPFDSHYDLVTNYESDSDEGSLFTLSSEDYDDARSLPEEQVSVENGGASQPFPSRNLGEYEDHVTSAGSYEDITPQRIVEKCEIQEALFGNLISSPDSFV